MRHLLAFGSSGRVDRDPRPREPSAPSLNLCGGRVAIYPPRAGEERRPGEVTPTSLSQAGKRGSSFRPLTPRACTLSQHLGQMAPTGFKKKMQPPGGHPCHAATGLPGNKQSAAACRLQAGDTASPPQPRPAQVRLCSRAPAPAAQSFQRAPGGAEPAEGRREEEHSSPNSPASQQRRGPLRRARGCMCCL